MKATLWEAAELIQSAINIPGTVIFLLRQTAVFFKVEPHQGLGLRYEIVQSKLSAGTEKPDYFDPLTYFCLNEMWGSENTKDGSI